jgi:hypothetical protein
VTSSVKDGSTVHSIGCSCGLCGLGLTKEVMATPLPYLRCKAVRFTTDDARCLLDEGHVRDHNFDTPGDDDRLIARSESNDVE